MRRFFFISLINEPNKKRGAQSMDSRYSQIVIRIDAKHCVRPTSSPLLSQSAHCRAAADEKSPIFGAVSRAFNDSFMEMW